MLCVVLFLDFILEEYYIFESDGYVPIGVTLSGGISNTPVTVIVTPTERSPLSATGTYVC